MKIISRSEAKALNLRLYFTGKACKYGHVAARTMAGGCTECQVIRTAAWRKANAEKWRGYSRSWRSNNLEFSRELARTYARANSERRRAWYEANRQKVIDRGRAWRKSNPDRVSAIKNKRRAREAGGGFYTAADIAELYRLQGGRCACGCNEPLKKKYHVDHIVPLSLGGSSNKNNIQLLRPRCNMRKHAKDPIVFAQENGRLL